MTGLAVLLTAVSLCDLVSGGLSGTPRGQSHALVGVAVASLVSALSISWIASSGVSWFGWLALVVVACAGWAIPRIEVAVSSARAGIALGLLTSSVLVFVALSGRWPDRLPDSIEAWSDGLAFTGIAERSPAELFLAVSVLLFLSAPANGVVRAILTAAGTEIEGGEQRLRGGRFIGVIERYLIFGLAVAGEPTAAALVVSAKSILRFPELSRKAGARGDGHRLVADVDIVTEYFLLGSLTSWLLALVPVVLFR